MTEIPDRLRVGPKEGLHYPLSVQYCGNCSMPIEVSASIVESSCWEAIQRWFFDFSIASTTRTTKSARLGWKRICHLSSQIWKWRTEMAVQLVRMTRSDRNEVVKECWKRRKQRTMSPKRFACRELLVAKRKVSPSLLVSVHSVRTPHRLHSPSKSHYEFSIAHRHWFESCIEILRNEIRVWSIRHRRRWNRHSRRRQRRTVRHHSGKMAWNRRRLYWWSGRAKTIDSTIIPRQIT